MSADGRYAPSPTGELHLGNLRTALLAWLFARSQGARFVLRIEDLDRDRSRRTLESAQLRDLSAIGIDWDDDVVRQSERVALYDETLQKLETYECWCTRAEIHQAASAPHGIQGRYPGTCAQLTSAQVAQRRATDRPPALRVRARSAEIVFVDRLHGPQRGVVDDFVVRRNDGAHAYNLAVVVDDGAQGIGEVVRGEDLLDSTHRQLWLAEQLALPRPSHAHVPLVLGPDGSRLAKRHGAVILAQQDQNPAAVRARLLVSAGLDADVTPETFDRASWRPPPSGPMPA